VLWGPFDRAVLERAGPDHIVERPEDLVALLTKDEERGMKDEAQSPS